MYLHIIVPPTLVVVVRNVLKSVICTVKFLFLIIAAIKHRRYLCLAFYQI
jgi:hypothetical protein